MGCSREGKCLSPLASPVPGAAGATPKAWLAPVPVSSRQFPVHLTKVAALGREESGPRGGAVCKVRLSSSLPVIWISLPPLFPVFHGDLTSILGVLALGEGGTPNGDTGSLRVPCC